MFHLGETPNVGGHGVVDGRIELAQARKEFVADAVAAGYEGLVGDVFDVVEAMLGDIAVDVSTGEWQQGTDDDGAMDGGPRAYAVEAGDAGAAEEVEEEGLDGVVAMVRYGDAGVALALAKGCEPAVAKVARRLLEAHGVLLGVEVGVEIDGVERDVVRLGQAVDKLLVAVAVAGAQVEIAMGHGEGYAGAATEVEHDHGVAATANSEQHLLPRREEVLLAEVVDELLQHHRRIILRMRRRPSTSMP